MNVTLVHEAPSKVEADLLVVATRTGKKGEGGAFDLVADALGAALTASIDSEGFTGAEGQVLRVPSGGAFPAKTVAVVGLGTKVSPGDARTYVQRAVQAARTAKRLAIVLPEATPDAVRLAAESARSSAYRYTRFKTGDRKPKSEVTDVVLVSLARLNQKLRAAADEGVAVANAIELVRDLVNAPPNELHAVALADEAKRVAADRGLACDVFGKKRLEKLGMELFLAVNKGSANEPRLVHLSYIPKRRAKKKVVFVGKGLTFDSGGLCIKPAASMVTMKCDMAGAATTLGIIMAAADLELPIEIHALLGCTDNMTGADAYRPGDVIKSLDGKTVEIINTDAEGRLVLADVLTYAAKLAPDYLIDHATLTGACMVALGPYRAGFFANDDELAARYLEAASIEGESYHRLPLDEDLRSLLDSDIADLKHVGGQYGGAITAALFLREFIGTTKWAHCDIAGPAFLDRAVGRYPKGASGFGVSTGVRFLRLLSEPSAKK